MSVQIGEREVFGHLQNIEATWKKIYNDSRISDVVNKIRNFVSDGPFLAVVVGSGAESKPVVFAVLPLVGQTQAGRVLQAIEETTSGRPTSIATVFTVLQSLGATSIPGMVVGTAVSGAINTVKLLNKHKQGETPDAAIPETESLATACNASETTRLVNETDRGGGIQDERINPGSRGYSDSYKSPSDEVGPIIRRTVSKDKTPQEEPQTILSGIESLAHREAEKLRCWYKVVVNNFRNTQSPFKAKL
ncbi:hypothetical protein RHS03_06614, partial [Rhizoctonia solani]